ncbi:MAG TPA: hypothetical protein VNL95_06395 [Dehalococcoidia bacterium]|nr:hypothetical protein [Dehalococcoidia bacterium]
MLSLRLELEPLVVFERAVGDERAYADMTDPVLLWVGRHDNAMGRGKGSSVRQLLPEEAVKLARLLRSEPGQQIAKAIKQPYPNQRLRILNKGNTPVEHLLLKRQGSPALKLVDDELMLNFHVARTIDAPGSSFRAALRDAFDGMEIEYVSSEFPWGYTGGTADLVCALACGGRRRRIVIAEMKKDAVSNDAVIQVSLYVRWVVQCLAQFADPPCGELEVVPVVVGRWLDEDLCRPDTYSYTARFLSGATVGVRVWPLEILVYEPKDVYHHTSGALYAKDILYRNESRKVPLISWQPPAGVATTPAEREWVRTTGWEEARRKARLARR